MPLVLPLGQAHDAHAWRCGAKAATLSRLLAQGFPVPPGFVVTADAFELVTRHNGNGDQLAAALRALDRAAAEADAAAADLRAMIVTARMPEHLAAEVAAACDGLGDRPLAVRSSSSLEDRADLSFAGQHDSFLDVRGADACLAAVRRVWASLYNARALASLSALGISPGQERMAVLVQAMVPARWAGVGFTVHPLSGDAGEIVLHAVPGPGEGCVSGSLASDEITLTRQPLAVAAVRSVRQGAELLGDARALAVARLLVRTEETLDLGPLDVEWAVTGDDHGDDDGVRLLQARPMTSGVGEPGIRWESPVPGAHWRRRWRLGEWLREPVTPLFATWAIPRLIASRERCGTGSLGWRHPRSFSMPAPWFCLVHGYFYARQDLPADVGAGMPFADRLRRMRELRAFLRRWSRDDLPAYLERFERHRALDVEALPAARLLELVETLLDEAGELWYVIAPLGYGFERMVFAPHYERLLGASDPPHHSVLFRGYPSPGLDAQQALYELSRRLRADPEAAALLGSASPAELARDPRRLPDWLRRELDGHHREYGHQVRNLDFYFPTLGEDPEETLAALMALVHHDLESPHALLEKSRREREEAQARVLALLRDVGPEGDDLAELMGCFQTNAAVRERAIFSFQLGWPLLRRALSALGRALADWETLEEPEQVFFLERDELAGAVAARERGDEPTAFAEVARGRRRTWERRRALEPPETIPRETGNPQVRRRCGFVDDAEGPRLVGQGVSAGFYRGRVRIVNDLADPIAKGDVLVTPTASPALTPLMLLAGALVVDLGGGASHSSLVARELGLPTVVNTLEATRRLRDGQIVEVHGGEGVVRLL